MSKKLSALYICLLLLLISFSLFVWSAENYVQRHQDEPVEFGVSFSQKYARELGLNWQTAYLATLRELGVKNIRLMSYWDIHEPKNDAYDFSELDWMMAEAGRQKVNVSLAIGLRQPRWPECHQPAWTHQLKTNHLQEELLEYLRQVVSRYKSHAALGSWQLENEAANELFGVCPKFDRSFYLKEYNLVKDLDKHHDLATSASNQIGVPLNKPVGDKIGFSIYNHATPRVAGQSIYWSYWYVLPLWHSFRAHIAETLHPAETFVHELQAEPWGRQATNKLSGTEQLKLMNPQLLKENVQYARDAGFKEIYLWGAEWWYWRKIEANDPSMWSSAQEIFNPSDRY